MQIPVEDIVRILPKGMVTIPKKLRQDVGLEENSLARVRKEGRRLILEPVSVVGYPLRVYSKEEIKEFIEDDKLSPELVRKAKKLFK